ncbi:patatin-like phospholipase family protein [Dethiothermospora halolimnae]|uniref:patatin-like phospholipase family protein n=1 Tax=Dethiothermospora halolimnae TaxID=3114390 RepID=UPI003CCC10CD
MTRKINVGLALGSGGARGLAHIGVLKALEENNVNIDVVSGSSAGALVGSLYCSNIPPAKIEDIINQIDRKMWMDVTVPRRGFIKGNQIEQILKILTRNRNIEDLNKKLAIVATDLKESKKIVFTEGPLYKAVRASISVPGVFLPVKMDNMVLVDGGVIDRVPVSIARELGADIVIAVDVGFSTEQRRINHIFDVILQSIDVMAKQILNESLMGADILIKPPISHISPSKFDKVVECSKIGYKATIEGINEIKGKLEQIKIE